MTGWKEDTIAICIPVLNAYDDLDRCIESISNSSIACNVFVIDNGGSVKQKYYENVVHHIHTPLHNLGVAASWNWFIDNVPGTRIICNDDIIFDRYAIEKIIHAHSRNQDSLIFPQNLGGNVFSCFLLPDSIISSVGRFDESISPMYAYFEDNDYSYRMTLEGFGTSPAEGSFVEHVGSSTLKHFDSMDERKHHDKFRAARDRYISKWGGGPGEEKYRTPYNK